MDQSKRYLGIDVGAKRVGLATAEADSLMARPLKTISVDQLQAVIKDHGPFEKIVVGLPRGLDGQNTAQTIAVQRWADDHLNDYDQLIVWQDEAGTSSVAEAELKAMGKPYERGDIDSAAAAIILQDYLDNL